MLEELLVLRQVCQLLVSRRQVQERDLIAAFRRQNHKPAYSHAQLFSECLSIQLYLPRTDEG